MTIGFAGELRILDTEQLRFGDGVLEVAGKVLIIGLAEMRRVTCYRCYLMYDVTADGDDTALRDAPAGAPLGTFSLLVFPVMVHDGRPEAIVEAGVVAPAARGRGIGKQMMREAMRLAREAGAAKLALSSNARRLQAHRFYRELGFTEHGISFSIALANGSR